jgi:hypothetical protein
VSLNQFKASPLGALIGPIMNPEEMIRRMETKSASDRPALEAVGKDIEARVGSLDDEQKKLVGRWVKEVLEPRGWRPIVRGGLRRAISFRGGRYTVGRLRRPLRGTARRGWPPRRRSSGN